MLRNAFIVMMVLTFGAACAQDTDVQDCVYATKVIYHLPDLEGAAYLSEVKGIEPRSKEDTVTHTIHFSNGDTATLEQKYCSMYNFQLSYKIKKLSKKNFVHCLDNIDKLIRGVKQDYQLKAPLRDIIDMTMNQRSLSINSAFSYDLPEQVVNSNETVEQTISFTPYKDRKSFDAEVEFYFAIGGLPIFD